MAMTTMHDLFANKTINRPPTPLKQLLLLPSTAELEETYSRVRDNPRRFVPPVAPARWSGQQTPSPHEEELDRDLKFAASRLADGKERDAIQATRPEGCWCLGLGGDEERTTGDDTYLSKTCTCPEGLAAAEHKETVKEAQRKQRNEARIENVWDNALIPARFYEFRLDTSPWCKTHPEILESLAGPSAEWCESASARDVSAAMDAWLERSWFLYGPYGAGKTGIAIGIAWCRVVDDSGLSNLRFVAGPRLFSELRSTYNRDSGETEQEVIDRYAKADLLILDDIGAEQVKNQDWLADRLYQIVGERHDELRPTIFTSNLTLEQLAKRVGERVTWRIVEMVGKNIIHVDGPNLRA